MNPALQERAANSSRTNVFRLSYLCAPGARGKFQPPEGQWTKTSLIEKIKHEAQRRQRAKTPPLSSMNPWADLATVMTDDDQGGTNDIE